MELTQSLANKLLTSGNIKVHEVVYSKGRTRYQVTRVKNGRIIPSTITIVEKMEIPTKD